MCTAVKLGKWVKPLWYGREWSKYKYGEAWQINYITLLQTHQGKCYMLTVVEGTTGWVDLPHATQHCPEHHLALEKQILCQHGTPERIESDNSLIDI